MAATSAKGNSCMRRVMKGGEEGAKAALSIALLGGAP